MDINGLYNTNAFHHSSGSYEPATPLPANSSGNSATGSGVGGTLFTSVREQAEMRQPAITGNSNFRAVFQRKLIINLRRIDTNAEMSTAVLIGISLTHKLAVGRTISSFIRLKPYGSDSPGIAVNYITLKIAHSHS